MIAARNLTKTFGGATVLRGVTLDVAPGECVALLGANGAGKTTFLKLAATLLRPTAGHLSVLGHDVARDPERVRGEIGLIGHGSYLYEDLTALENLQFWAAAGEGRAGPAELRDLLAAVELDGVADQRVRSFSAGMKRRLSLARCLHAGARLLLLDEPFAALDQSGKQWLEAFLLAQKHRGGAIVMATHSFGRGLGVADRVAILHDGVIALDRSCATLAPGELDGLYALHAGAR